MSTRSARTASAPRDSADNHRTLQRMTGVSGLLAPVLILGPISATSGQEPGFDGDAAAVRAFFVSTATGGHALGAAVVTVGLLALLWFAVGLGLVLAAAEGSPPWRTVIGAGSAVAFVGWVLLLTRHAPRWLGWVALGSGIGLVISRFMWTSPTWIFPYALLWLWVIALAIRMLRESRRGRVPTRCSRT